MHNKKVKKPQREFLIVAVALLLVLTIFMALFLLNQGNVFRHTGLLRVACVGDSITQSTGYPYVLQAMLGERYEVGNFGVSGATVLLNTDKPYLNQTACLNAMIFNPTVVVIMLGTNDARINIYQESVDFELDYEQLVRSFQTSKSSPTIWIALPPPIFNNSFSLSEKNLVQGIIPKIKDVAKNMELPLIDTYSALINHSEYFPDGVHPNPEGARVIATAVYGAIAANTTVQPSNEMS